MLEVGELLERGRRSSIRVGIGCSRETMAAIVSRLGEMKSDIRLIAYEDEMALLGDLRDGRIGAAVRGTLSSSATMNGIKEIFQTSDVKRVALLEDSGGKSFLLAPVGVDEGRDFDSRLSLVEAVISYFSEMNWRLRIGVLSKGRTEDVSRGTEIRASIEEGRRMAEQLAKDGHDAEHYSILIEDAERDCDLVVAPDGVSGNLIFRTLHFLGGCKAYGAPVVNLHGQTFVDTSRAKADFTDSVLVAAGLDAAHRKSP